MTPLPESRRSDNGLPEWTRERILYNSASNTLVAVMYRGFGAEDAPVRRLYYRRLPEKTYEPVPVRHELEGHEYAHCCQSAPFLIFNEIRYEATEPYAPVSEYLKGLLKPEKVPQTGWGFDWTGIRRVNLETGEDRRVLEADSFHQIPRPYESWWVTRILSVSADGATAVCTVCLIAGGKADNCVYEVSLAEGLKQKIADLPHNIL
jgi:hypothetical protein